MKTPELEEIQRRLIKELGSNDLANIEDVIEVSRKTKFSSIYSLDQNLSSLTRSNTFLLDLNINHKVSAKKSRPVLFQEWQGQNLH